MFKNKRHKEIFLEIIGVVSAMIIIFVVVFSLFYLKEHGEYQDRIADKGCLIGPKVIGFTKDINKEELSPVIHLCNV